MGPEDITGTELRSGTGHDTVEDMTHDNDTKQAQEVLTLEDGSVATFDHISESLGPMIVDVTVHNLKFSEPVRAIFQLGLSVQVADDGPKRTDSIDVYTIGGEMLYRRDPDGARLVSPTIANGIGVEEFEKVLETVGTEAYVQWVVRVGHSGKG